MNDRCAAGCGRYLGYIADEMNMVCTSLAAGDEVEQAGAHQFHMHVFAGAELRDRLSLARSAKTSGRPSSGDHPARNLHHFAIGRSDGRVHLHRRRCQE